MKRIFFIALIAVLMVGCSAGVNFTFKDVKTVEVGDTTKQLIEKMGARPYNISTSKQGDNYEEVWQWIYVDGFTHANKKATFVVRDNKVIEVPHVSDGILEQ